MNVGVPQNSARGLHFYLIFTTDFLTWNDSIYRKKIIVIFSLKKKSYSQVYNTPKQCHYYDPKLTLKDHLIPKLNKINEKWKNSID